MCPPDCEPHRKDTLDNLRCGRMREELTTGTQCLIRDDPALFETWCTPVTLIEQYAVMIPCLPLLLHSTIQQVMDQNMRGASRARGTSPHTRRDHYILGHAHCQTLNVAVCKLFPRRAGEHPPHGDLWLVLSSRGSPQCLDVACRDALQWLNRDSPSWSGGSHRQETRYVLVGGQ